MLIAIVLLAMQTAPVPPPSSAEEIVVIGERMRHLKFSIKTDKTTGGYRCKITRPTFDPAFDALICAMAKGCATSIRKWSQFEGCMKPQVEAYARDLVARRKVNLPPTGSP